MLYFVAYKTTDEAIYHIIPNAINTWVADPFLFEYEGETYIFGEIWKYSLGKNGRGTIGFCKFNDEGPTEWKVIIKEKYHLSFPNIFRVGSDIFLCPESGDIGKVYLYRAVDFPYKWERADCIYDDGDKLVDTVFWNNDGRRFGFTYCVEDKFGNKKDELRGFEIVGGKMCFESFKNPISIDKSVARCAGKVIYEADKMIRVSQDCERSYGRGLIFSEFYYKEKYMEHVIRTLYPNDLRVNKKKKIIGTHTYNRLGKYEVIDIRTVDFSIIMILMRIINRIRRIFGIYEQ